MFGTAEGIVGRIKQDAGWTSASPLLSLEGLRLVKVIAPDGISASAAQTDSKVLSVARTGEILMPYGASAEKAGKLVGWLKKVTRARDRSEFSIHQPCDTGNVVAFGITTETVTRNPVNSGFLNKGTMFIVNTGYRLPEGTRFVNSH